MSLFLFILLHNYKKYLTLYYFWLKNLFDVRSFIFFIYTIKSFIRWNDGIYWTRVDWIGNRWSIFHGFLIICGQWLYCRSQLGSHDLQTPTTCPTLLLLVHNCQLPFLCASIHRQDYRQDSSFAQWFD